jgi:methyl-accepting chemotaxis protein
VLKFWSAVEQGLLPALDKGDEAAANRAFADVTQAYQDHRTVIDAIVADADLVNKALEAQSTSLERAALAWVVALVVFLLAIVGVGIAYLIRQVVRPIVRLTGEMTQLASGDLGVEIEDQLRAEEIATMAAAVQVFKHNAVVLKETETETAAQERALAEQRRASEEERGRTEAARLTVAALRHRGGEQRAASRPSPSSRSARPWCRWTR